MHQNSSNGRLTIYKSQDDDLLNELIYFTILLTQNESYNIGEFMQKLSIGLGSLWSYTTNTPLLPRHAWLTICLEVKQCVKFMVQNFQFDHMDAKS